MVALTASSSVVLPRCLLILNPIYRARYSYSLSRSVIIVITQVQHSARNLIEPLYFPCNSPSGSSGPSSCAMMYVHNNIHYFMSKHVTASNLLPFMTLNFAKLKGTTLRIILALVSIAVVSAATRIRRNTQTTFPASLGAQCCKGWE